MNYLTSFTELKPIQMAFVIIVPIVLILFLVFCLYIPISGAYRKKNFQIHLDNLFVLYI